MTQRSPRVSHRTKPAVILTSQKWSSILFLSLNIAARARWIQMCCLWTVICEPPPMRSSSMRKGNTLELLPFHLIPLHLLSNVQLAIVWWFGFTHLRATTYAQTDGKSTEKEVYFMNLLMKTIYKASQRQYPNVAVIIYLRLYMMRY